MMKDKNVGKFPKMEKVLEKLREVAKVQAAREPAPPLTQGGQGRGGDFHTSGSKPVETVADDGDVAEGKRAAIEQTEALVRPALKLFGVDYDALIKMDGKSAYAQAVAARPDVVGQVLASDNPVLAALDVAVKFTPYADFAGKYGSSPDEVKQNITKEVLAAEGEPAAAAGAGVVFSRPYGGQAVGKVKTADFASIFKK